MAINALRDDLFALITAFASPRQGAGDNVALTSQQEVAKQQPQPGPPPTDPNQPLPFTPPVPTASRRVPEADLPAPGASPVQLQAGGEGGFAIPGTGQIVKPGTGPDAKNAPPPDPTTPPVLTGETPPADGGTANIMDMVKQQMAAQQKQQAANQRMGGLQQLVSGGQMLMSSLTRSPMTGAMLANAAQQSAQAAGSTAAGGGAGAKGADGMPSMSEMLALQKYSDEAGVRQANKKRLPGLAKHLGVPLDVLETMDDKDLSELLQADSSRDRKIERNEDGTFTILDPRRPNEPPRIVGEKDPYRVSDQAMQEKAAAEATAEANRKAEAFPGEQKRLQAEADQKAAKAERDAQAFPSEQSRLAAEEARKEAEELRTRELHPGVVKRQEVDTEKVAGEALKLGNELRDKRAMDAAVADPVRVKEIADRLGLTPADVGELHRTGQLGGVLGEMSKGTNTYKDWVSAGKPGKYEDWVKQREEAGRHISTPETEHQKYTQGQAQKAGEASKAAASNLPTQLDLNRMLKSDKLYTGVIWGRNDVSKAGKVMNELGFDVGTGAKTMEEVKGKLKEALLGKLGGGYSDADRKAVEDILGSGEEISIETLRNLNTWAIKKNMSTQLSEREALEDALEANPNAKHLQKRLDKIDRQLVDVTDEIFSPADAKTGKPAEVDNFLEGYKANPNMAIRNFDKIHGRGMGEYVLRMKGVLQ